MFHDESSSSLHGSRSPSETVGGSTPGAEGYRYVEEIHFYPRSAGWCMGDHGAAITRKGQPAKPGAVNMSPGRRRRIPRLKLVATSDSAGAATTGRGGN